MTHTNIRNNKINFIYNVVSKNIQNLLNCENIKILLILNRKNEIIQKLINFN